MTHISGQEAGIIAVSFLIALLLTAIPLPEWAIAWRPAWLTMVLIYWCMVSPKRVSVGTGWLLGFLLDVLKGSLLGQHAAGFAFVAFITVKAHRRIRAFPLAQQALFVGSMIALNGLLTLWIQTMIGLPPQYTSFWLPVLTSMPLWPWLYIILSDLRLKAQAS
jgi:rod shape-determining protein MreD